MTSSWIALDLKYNKHFTPNKAKKKKENSFIVIRLLLIMFHNLYKPKISPTSCKEK